MAHCDAGANDGGVHLITPAAIECLQTYIAETPDDLDAQKWLAELTGDLDEAVRLLEIQIGQAPNFWYPKLQLSEVLAQQGEWSRIVNLIQTAFPDLMTAKPEINDWNHWPARRLAEALLQTGATEQANILIDATLTHFEQIRKMQAGGWTAGVEDALLLALIGEYDRAMDRLQQAIDSGWIFLHNPICRTRPLTPFGSSHASNCCWSNCNSKWQNRDNGMRTTSIVTC